MKVTLDTEIPRWSGSDDTWTLSEAFESMKKQGLTRLLERTDEEVSERLGGLERSVERGDAPTNGQVLAAYYVAKRNAIDDEWLADDSTVTDRQRAARQAALTRVVFRRKR